MQLMKWCEMSRNKEVVKKQNIYRYAYDCVMIKMSSIHAIAISNNLWA